jgi:hypothetical protein
MYRYYRRLALHGYTEYVPINEFDIANMKRLKGQMGSSLPNPMSQLAG